jgi:nucleoside-diphosphate-sugar epimerase
MVFDSPARDRAPPGLDGRFHQADVLRRLRALDTHFFPRAPIRPRVIHFAGLKAGGPSRFEKRPALLRQQCLAGTVELLEAMARHSGAPAWSSDSSATVYGRAAGALPIPESHSSAGAGQLR